jgi:SNF2 family DNA or RNA helicase
VPKLKKRISENYLPVHEAFPYQMEAFQVLRDLEYGAVFHEQGLGKTKIAIDLGLYWLSEDIVDSVIFVTKKSLVKNWEREILTHTNIKPRIFSSDRSKNYHLFNMPARFYIAHYEAIKSEKERFQMFSKTRILSVVLDEAQKIKNPESALFNVFKDLSESFVRRMVLTGTPIANRPFDIWSPIYFLDKGNSLGKDFNEFKEDYDLTPEMHEDESEKISFSNRLDTIFKRIGNFSIRETKDTAGIELPNKIYRTQICEWETVQEELYLSYVEEAKAILFKDGELKEDTVDGVLKKLLRLLQVASNPSVIDDNYSQQPGKFEELYRILSTNRDAGEKSIVWTSFTKNADWLNENLAEFGAVKIHGKMDMDSRYRSIDRIMTSKDCWVLIATPGAAKEGLTLTKANHVIFYDRGFSLDDYLQAQDRIHRISQEHECYITKLILPGSIDEWVDELLIAKELSAKLGLGDISKKEFLDSIDFSFFASLKAFLTGEEKGHV